ncbi:uncharacterized protein LOC122082083 [Macadamia integrifolia]|uniref:uncharacterized protein LOC122082083 n=1 Tax=Macadamia integrifolia TaxID=60698 RepID=UPI001C4E94C1|nr:uncharacterized protein LOC122082083 [Macadamia integrifolia]
MPLATVYEKLKKQGLLHTIVPKPISNLPPIRCREYDYCAYHNQKYHPTERCFYLRHVVQILVNNGTIEMKAKQTPNVTTNLLPEYRTINMLGEEEECQEDPTRLIRPKKRKTLLNSRIYRGIKGSRARRMMREVERAIDEDGLGVIGQPAPSPPPLKAHIIQIPPSAIHRSPSPPPMQSLMFFNAELPIQGVNHNRALHITVECHDKVMPHVLIDSRSSLNVMPLRSASSIGLDLGQMRPSNQTLRAYDNTKREILGVLTVTVIVGPARFDIDFQVIDIPTSFNMLLGRSWLHQANAVSSSLHKKLKFMHEEKVIIVSGDLELVNTLANIEKVGEHEGEIRLNAGELKKIFQQIMSASGVHQWVV